MSVSEHQTETLAVDEDAWLDDFVNELGKAREPADPARQNGRESDWDHVVSVLRKHFYEPDIEAARVLYAAVAAHALNGQPVWPMAVAPPGSMKTELIRALQDLDRVHAIDAVTSKTFLSGQIKDGRGNKKTDRKSSLLHRVGDNGIILCPDFSTVLSIKSEDRNSVLADMRRIFDGELRKEFGTSEPAVEWKGRITFVVAVTEDIDKHYSVIQSLGDRFVMVRWGRAGEEAAIKAMTQDVETVRNDLKRAVHSLFGSLTPQEPTVTPQLHRRLAALAEFSVRGRSHVPRDGPDKAVIGFPHAESATRLAQQLCQLAKGSARLSRRDSLTDADFAAARRAGYDCIPARRRLMLDWCREGGTIVTSTSTKRYDREDLEVLGLVEGDGLSDLANRLLRDIEGDEFTESPPGTSDQIDIGVGGTSGEPASEGGVL